MEALTIKINGFEVVPLGKKNDNCATKILADVLNEIVATQKTITPFATSTIMAKIGHIDKSITESCITKTYLPRLVKVGKVVRMRPNNATTKEFWWAIVKKVDVADMALPKTAEKKA